MRRAMFIAGFAVGFVAGTRAGRERYDQMMRYGRQVAGSPSVQKVTQTVTTKTTEFTKTAMTKAPDIAKKTAERIPSRLRGKAEPGDVSPDGSLVYPAEGPQTSVNGVRYSE